MVQSSVNINRRSQAKWLVAKIPNIKSNMAEPLQQPSKKESEEDEQQPQELEPQKENALDSEKLEEAQESVEPQTQEDIPEKPPEAIPTSEPLQEKETDKKEPETSPPEKPKDVSIEATEPQGTKQEDDDNKPISYNYEELYSKPVLTSSMQQDTLQFLYPSTLYFKRDRVILLRI